MICEAAIQTLQFVTLAFNRFLLIYTCNHSAWFLIAGLLIVW